MAELVVGIDTSEKLPDGYTRLEYLRSVNGAQWIVDTTLTTMSSGSYEIKVSNLTSLCRFVGFASGSASSSGDGYTTQSGIATSNSVSDPTNTYFPISYQNNGWNDDSTNKVNIVQENILKYEFHQGEQKLYVNGVLNKQGNVTTLPSGSYPFRLFRVGDNVYGISFNGSSSIHYCKVYNANGELIRNYIPCKNSSNVLGMYELVTNRFLTNTGSGTFTAGSEYTPDIQYARVPALVVGKAQQRKYQLLDRVKDDSNNDIGIVTGFFTKNVEGHNLPDTYQELEYVELDHAYIDTGIVLDTAQAINTMKLHLTVSTVAWPDSGHSNHLLGCRTIIDGISNDVVLFTGGENISGVPTETYFGIRFGTTAGIWRLDASTYPQLLNRYRYDIDNLQETITDVETNTVLGTNTATAVDWASTTDLRINGLKGSVDNWYAESFNTVRFYDFEIEGIAHMIPAKRKSDNVVGMYDIIRNQFYTQTNTTGYSTTAIAGPYIIPENTEYAIVCLNAQYRIENNNSNATYCTGTVSNQKYYTTIEDVWNTTDTATEINDALYTEKSTDAVAINYLRTNFSFTIEGNVYKPQVPNIPELYSILNNFTVINNGDPTASSYPTKTLKTGTELGAVLPSFPESQYGYRSCQFVNNWQTISYWACGFIANQGISRKNGPSSGSNVYAFVVPVLELPNQIIG